MMHCLKIFMQIHSNPPILYFLNDKVTFLVTIRHWCVLFIDWKCKLQDHFTSTLNKTVYHNFSLVFLLFFAEWWKSLHIPSIPRLHRQNVLGRRPKPQEDAPEFCKCLHVFFMTKISRLGSWYPNFGRVFFFPNLLIQHVALLRGPLTRRQISTSCLWSMIDRTGPSERGICMLLRYTTAVIITLGFMTFGVWHKRDSSKEGGRRVLWLFQTRGLKSEVPNPTFVLQCGVLSNERFLLCFSTT